MLRTKDVKVNGHNEESNDYINGKLTNGHENDKVTNGVNGHENGITNGHENGLTNGHEKDGELSDDHTDSDDLYDDDGLHGYDTMSPGCGEKIQLENPDKKELLVGYCL